MNETNTITKQRAGFKYESAFLDGIRSTQHRLSVQIHLAAALNNRHPMSFLFDVVGVQGKARRQLNQAIRRAVRSARYLNTRRFQPSGCPINHKLPG